MAGKILLKSHWDVLIEFMESHPELAKGQFVGPTGRQTQKKMWELLAMQLNSLGAGSKPVAKWQKTWTDFKYNLKKKTAALKVDRIGTGGGPPSVPALNAYEERVLQLLGPTFYRGVGAAELGLPSESREEDGNEETELVESPQLAEEEIKQSLVIDETPVIHGKPAVHETAAIHETPAKRIRLVYDKQKPSTSRQAEQREFDHRYAKKPKTSRIPSKDSRKSEMDLIGETVELLRQIKETMDSGLEAVNSTLKDINETLRRNRDL